MNTNTQTLALDIGYGHIKYMYQGKVNKIPTSISLANDNGLGYNQGNIYDFEGDKYYIGETNSTDTFSTTEYKLLQKFAPLLIYHLRKVLQIPDEEVLEISTGLALIDWKHRKEFLDRITECTVNGKTVKNKIKKIVPQASGVYVDFLKNYNDNVIQSKVSIIDLGYNTVNFVYVEDGAFKGNLSNGYPNSGVVSILRGFTSYLSNTYSMNFTEQDASQIFYKGHFKFNGVIETKVSEKIVELKRNFVQKLMSSVLVNDKKLLTTSDTVVIAGGGAYLLQGVKLPPHYVILDSPEYSNVRGYSL